MAWLESPLHAAAELEPSVWTMVAAECRRGQAPRFRAGASFDPAAASVSEDIRQLRVSHHLPLDASVILWPLPGDEGVTALDDRSDLRVVLPKARIIRERVARFVKAGERVTEVWLPHEAVVRLVRLAGWDAACVCVLQPEAACLVAVDGERVEAKYLAWPGASTVEPPTDAARLLSRYQFAARLMPYVREVAGLLPDARMAVCGRYPDLRSAMVPLVEELDREVDVLDAGLIGQAHGDAPEPGDASGLQLAWAAAVSSAA